MIKPEEALERARKETSAFCSCQTHDGGTCCVRFDGFRCACCRDCHSTRPVASCQSGIHEATDRLVSVALLVGRIQQIQADIDSDSSHRHLEQECDRLLAELEQAGK